MKIFIIITVVVVVVGIIFMPKKKNVTKKLDKAKKLFGDGEIVKVNQMLDEIIIFPISEKYSAEYANQLIESLNFLKQVCKAQNITKDNLIDPVLQKLKGIQVEGGKIDSEEIEPLEQWVEKMSKDAYSQAKQLLKDAAQEDIEVVESGREDDFTSEVTEQSEINILNQIGTFMLKRKLNEGIQYIDEHMSKEMTPFKASLLDSKAGMYFMDGKVHKAVECYKEILIHYPESYRIKTSLAEGYVELKEYEKALSQAKEVLNSSQDKDNVKTCKKIVNKYGN
ncbi:tetratricopeptide repeat protein [Vallitalea maricola]|uniref:Uncharacterized protein n=1 Tax=Vallitalea maricola TaxID=3074433 RepID=A0ACB5ULU7_9FIRM|nr:hypothetical protein AN2V17_30760 [Vallitalea sp. AN17-2]